MRNLLTNLGLVSYDPSCVLMQLLSQQSHNIQITLSSTNVFEICTSSNAADLSNMLNNLDLFSRDFKHIIRKVIKTAKCLNVDLDLARDIVWILFKLNLARKTRKKKAKERKIIDYNSFISAFNCFLTLTKAQRRRDKEAKKIKKAKQKKKTMKIKKATTTQKKQEDEAIKEAKQAKKKELKAIKTEKVITRKKQREEKNFKKQRKRKRPQGETSVENLTILQFQWIRPYR